MFQGWDERDRGDRGRKGGRRNEEGLHYAELDLVRKPPEESDSDTPAPPRPKPRKRQDNQPTEYAAIRLY